MPADPVRPPSQASLSVAKSAKPSGLLWASEGGEETLERSSATSRPLHYKGQSFGHITELAMGPDRILHFQPQGPGANGPPTAEEWAQFLGQWLEEPRGPERVWLHPGLLKALRLPVDGFGLVQEYAVPPESAEDHEFACCHRVAFFQLPYLWHRHWRPAYPVLRSSEQGEGPPLRPPQPRGELYRRQDPRIGAEVSFRVLDVERDLERFNRWMNQERVAYYWELAGSREEHVQYLENLFQDPHAFPLIGAFDDQPFGYFEAYWAREDPLGDYYPAEDFDRGWHGLVGERRFLGRANTQAWLRAILHFLFLDDPRTERIVGEPRVDNLKMIRMAEAAGYDWVKTFDFPHKRAELISCPRTRFFQRQLP